jgi:linoleoyl-CoA desaturase
MKFTSKTNSVFFKELISKVDQYMGVKNGNRFGDHSIFIKAGLLISTYIICYGLLLSGKLNMGAAVLLVMLMGCIAVMIVFNIVHDASHHVLFKNPKYNKLAACLGDLVGMNSYIWDIRHNIQHHTFTNIAGGDILLDSIPLLRISPYQKKYWFHRYQVVYAPLLYALYSLFWVILLDISFFTRRQMGNLKNIRHPLREWVKLFFFKSLYISYMIIIPWMVTEMSLASVLMGFLLYHISAGMLLSLIVVLGHCVEGPHYVQPDEDGMIHNSWMQHEWDTTSDCATDSRLLHWISGGLNTHLAHHLFPKLCHCHYYEITRIIKSHCAEYNIHYPHYPFVSAIASHFRFLKKQAAG